MKGQAIEQDKPFAKHIHKTKDLYLEYKVNSYNSIRQTMQ